jgi:hypothetical protein
MQNLSLIHQVLDRSGDVFDRHFRIDAMLIEKVYAVGPQPLERSFNDQLDMIWFAVKPRKPLPRLLIDIPTEGIWKTPNPKSASPRRYSTQHFS